MRKTERPTKLKTASNRMVDQGIKNPINVAFGRALAKLRNGDSKLRPLSSRALAKELVSLSSSTYRMLQGGFIPVQSWHAADLARVFHLDWGGVNGMIGIISALDRCLPDTENALKECTKLAGISSNVRGVVRGIEPALKALHRGASGKEVDRLISGECVDRIVHFLQSASNSADLAPDLAVEWGKRLVHGRPPVFLDIVEGLLHDMQRFPPYSNPSSLWQWEESNYNRIRRAFGIISDHRQLPASVGKARGQYTWRFICNDTPTPAPANPKVRMLLLDDDVKGVKATQSITAFNSSLRATLKNLPEHAVVTTVVNPEVKLQIKKLLWIDLTSDPPNFPASDIDVNAASPIYEEFKNIWIYELEPRTPGQGSAVVAFMDDSVFSDRPTLEDPKARVVALSWSHMIAVKEFFH